jgi:hypothetical protein
MQSNPIAAPRFTPQQSLDLLRKVADVTREKGMRWRIKFPKSWRTVDVEDVTDAINCLGEIRQIDWDSRTVVIEVLGY